MQVIYLTGAPATGKSTLSMALQAEISSLEVWDYGERLRIALQEKQGAAISYESLRGQSARVATPQDIQALDTRLLEWVQRNRAINHLVIDTHAVTSEEYGFRVTPFDAERIRALAPTLIVNLYVSAETAERRISTDPQGRRSVNVFKAAMHTMLQSSVAVSYSILAGAPAYFLDAERPTGELVDWFRAHLQ
ncbi:ATP-binding protein [Nannocystis punicea]|uniref:ATP-binding protein n=1 Tax=Nannocystis punicea TaxID=2995304 RepID=A0ABY7HAS9_9BACT|nr:ATP-binding protein [Nannocystis poenicansa]WAS96389.1 ATP-binding protein [Nannocystis poenicansa]